MTIKARVAYQAMLFFNSTLLYAFVVHSTGSRDLLFFSAFLAALSLTANLAVQLSESQFRSGIWGLKMASVAVLTWVCLNTGITPPAMALALGISAVIVTNRDALAGAPSRLTMAAAAVPTLTTAVLIVLVWGKWIAVDADLLLMLLILPYLLTALASRRGVTETRQASVAGERLHAWTLIVSQLLPTASSFVMLTLVSYEKDATAVANFVMLERAVAIGGSLVYFYARVKGAFGAMAKRWVAAFVLAAALILGSFAFVDIPSLAISACYLAAGCLLSWGTVSLGARHARGILAINAVALGAILVASGHLTGIKPVQTLAVYICPQLLLMGALVVLASRQHA
ncbi:UNVERIFIED_ORG: hypothetical protein LHJ69_10210 [Shinella sp. XGS7]|nr:hypothetical protein [Shinella sp. XGS7]